MMGQAFHFTMRKPRVDYGFERYTEESKRLLSVLDKRVGEVDWLNGAGFSLAECAILPWVAGALRPDRKELAESMFGMSNFKNIPKWVERCLAIEATNEGLQTLQNKADEAKKAAEGKAE